MLTMNINSSIVRNDNQNGSNQTYQPGVGARHKKWRTLRHWLCLCGYMKMDSLPSLRGDTTRWWGTLGGVSDKSGSG